MILYVFNGHLGLPSLDIKSLQMMAYAKFVKMDIQINKKTFKPYTGSELPVLECEKGSITELEDFVEYLKFEAGSNLNLSDRNLTKLDKRFKPYEILFQETLKPALINVLWIDERNYREATRVAYSKISSFPLNFIVPNYLRNQASAYMENVYPVRNRKEFFSMELIEKAKDVIKQLSDTLSNNKYFNTASPNEIDAVIFGYLAVILKTELPRLNNLQQFIKERRNLIDYVERIMGEFFSDDISLSDQTANHTKESKEDFEVASWGSIALVGVFAIATNLLYFLLYKVPVEEDEDGESDDE